MSRHHEEIKNDPRWKRVRALCLARDDWTCQDCGRTDDLTADHIVPLALGGEPFELDNLVTVCRSCNSKRWSRTKAKQTQQESWINPRYSELMQIIRA